VTAIELDCEKSNKEEELEDDDGLLWMEALGQVEDNYLSFYDDDDAAKSSHGLHGDDDDEGGYGTVTLLKLNQCNINACTMF
jgi:hypothetical protein